MIPPPALAEDSPTMPAADPADTPRLVARALAPPGAPAPFDALRLDWERRWLRRAVVTTLAGRELLVDLAEATPLADGALLALTDGRTVAVQAEPEPLAEVRGHSPHHLMRLAWHLGNRHLPCRIEPGRLLIRPDHVIEQMLAHQGARIAHVTEPFQPEGGAYGGGGTHGAQGHGDGHAHGHDHSHVGDHDHGHSHGPAAPGHEPGLHGDAEDSGHDHCGHHGRPGGFGGHG
jgi:urease accessory protein